MRQRDEHYILSLCDKVLSAESSRQHRFHFLKGDKAERVNGIIKVIPEQGVKLPVDAYYEELNLVIEFLETQHFEPNKMMDARMTCSGVRRGEQRKIYDERRRVRLPENGIYLIELPYTEFKLKRKKLVQDAAYDEQVIRNKLYKFLRK